jgi:hypothetical protein
VKKASTRLSLILCLFLSTLPGQSQTRGPSSPAEMQRRLQEQQQQFQQQQEEFQRRVQEQQRQQVQNQEEVVRQMQERQSKNTEAMRRIRSEYCEQAWQEALGVTAEQWKAIRPRLERIRELKDTACVSISVYALQGGVNYQGSAFTETSDGGRSSAQASGQVSAAGVSHSDSRSSMSGVTGGGHGWSSVQGGAEFRGYSPGPIRKQVGDVSVGWRWERPSFNQSPDKLSEDDKACEQLLGALDTDKPDRDQVRRQVEALRKAREQRRAELAGVRQQLREIVTPEQEAKLILMGYLD